MEATESDNLNPPELCAFPGKWEEYEEILYEIFKETIIGGNLTFLGLRVAIKRHPEYKGKHFAFWHLISEGEKEEERTPDIRRCERLGWISWILSRYDDHQGISYWENDRKGAKNYVVWYEEGEYAVILSKRKDYFLLKTAYLVTSSHKISAFERDRDAYLKQTSK